MRRAWLFAIVLLIGGLLAAWLLTKRAPEPPSAASGADRARSADPSRAAPHLHGRARVEAAPAQHESPTARSPAQARLTGVVLLPDGTPAAGATVFVAGHFGARRAVTAGADGRFVLERFAGASPPVVATTSRPGCGYGVAPAPYLRAGQVRDVGTIRIGEGHVLAGQVVDQDGAPYEDVDISLGTEVQPVPSGWADTLLSDEDWSGHPTDEEGRFRFNRLPPGTYWVRAEAHEGPGGAEVWEHIPAGTTELRLVLPRAGEDAELSFRVVALGPDGAPIPRFDADLSAHHVDTRSIGTADDPAELWLDDGRPPYRILVHGPLDARGDPLGYAPVLLDDVMPRSAPYVVRMEVEGLEIRGRIVWDGRPRTWGLNAWGQLASDGRSVVDQVHLRPMLPDFLIEAESDASGVFVLRGLPPGKVSLFLDKRDEKVGRIQGGNPVVEAGAEEVVLHVVPAAALHLVARAPPDVALDRVDFLVYWPGDANAWIRQPVNTFGDAGREASWRYDGQDRDGEHRVVAEGTCDGALVGRAVLERVKPRAEPYVLQLVACPLIRGRAVTADDTPVADAPIRLYHPEGGPWRRRADTAGRAHGVTHTDAEGRFALRAPHEGWWFVSTTAPGLTPLPRAPLVEAGNEDVVVVLHPSLSISGRIVAPPGDATPPSLRLTAVPATGEVGLWHESTTLGGGFFDVPDLAPGTYRVVAWPDDDAPDGRYVRSAPVEAGARDLRLEVRRGGVLEGRVVIGRKDGRPARWVDLHLRGPWTNRLLYADENGWFRIGGIAPGRYVLRAQTPDGREAAREVEVPTGTSQCNLVVR